MKTFEKIIKEAMLSQKYKIGNKEVLNSLKGSKLVIMSSTIDSSTKEEINKQAESLNIKVLEYPGNSVKLGRACNKSFRISSISLRSIDDSDLDSLVLELSGKQ